MELNRPLRCPTPEPGSCFRKADLRLGLSPTKGAVLCHQRLNGLLYSARASSTLVYSQKEVNDYGPSNRNLDTFESLVSGCSMGRTLPEAMAVHAQAIECGFDCNVFIGNHLIQMYGDCTCLDAAACVFLKLQQPNLYSWNILISAFAKSRAAQTLELFKSMSFNPDRVTFLALLGTCGSSQSLIDGRCIHACLVSYGYQEDVNVQNTLIHMYGKCRSIADAEMVFAKIAIQNVVTCNTIIAAYALCGLEEKSLDVFLHLFSGGIAPDRVTFISVIGACASLVAFSEGQVIHAAIVALGFDCDVAIVTSLVEMYGKCKNLGDARATFAEIRAKNVISWTAMIVACAECGDFRSSLQVFQQMELEGAKPNGVTFICIIKACASLASPVEGCYIHACVIASGLEMEVILGVGLVDMYGKFRSLNEARAVFHKMPRHNVVSCSAMIAAFSENGHANEALELFDHMQVEGILPDTISYLLCLNACSILIALSKGQEVHAMVVMRAFMWDDLVGTALIHLYGKCGIPDDAMHAFDRLNCADVISWTAIINAYAQNGQGTMALKLFSRMQCQGIKPDGATFVSVLVACNHTGQIDDGRWHFTSMERDYGITPSIDHYVCMIDLFGRAGRLQEAENLLCRMSDEDMYVACLAMLAVCRIHGDVGRGKQIADYIFELNQEKDTPYVLLANIYAAAASSKKKVLWQDNRQV